ncbi:MAG TPA: serine protease [Bdellovibrio sp.]|nr:serine protease [Bdellovibrio sp.]
MTKFFLFLSVIVFTACATNNNPNSSSPKTDDSKTAETLVPKDLYRKVLPAIFEVVIPKPEDKGVVYEKPLRVDRMPYRVRMDKYISIGTAFAIGPNEFVSAAHVFPIYVKRFSTNFFIRDQDGHVYSVDKVLRYSVYRDLISFSVKSPSANQATLALSKQPDIGDMVFVIGNAQGEGISLRSGQISSFTPEEIENKWKFIRFSAPASPGNSGGPLLNEHGDVVGIVTRKNLAENLNYAIPIEELNSLSPNKADFIIRNQKISRDYVTNEMTWQYQASLPEEISALADRAQKSLLATTEKSIQKLYDPKDDRFFPANKQFQAFARHQHLKPGIGTLVPPKVGTEWTINFPLLKKIKISEKEFVSSYGVKNSYLLYVSKPESSKLQDFSSNPRMMLEQSLKAIELHRTYIDEKIRILSLGEPIEQGRWKDDVGRTWVEGFWLIPSIDMMLEQNCAALPLGAICSTNFLPIEALTIDVRTLLKKSLNSVTWSYSGSVDDWKNYLKEDKALLPDCLAGSSISLNNNKLKIHLGEKNLEFKGEVSNKNDIEIRTRYSPEVTTKIELATIMVRPNRESEVYFAKHWLWKPTAQSPESVQDFWNSAVDSKNKFDGKIHKDGKWSSVYLALKQDTQLDIPFIDYVVCGDITDNISEKLPEQCHEFLKANTAM